MNNDEIKEILDYLQENSKKDEATKQLVDYITNLQQENQELNKENEKWWAIIKDNEQEIKDLCLENSKLEQENERLKKQVSEYQDEIIDNIKNYLKKFENDSETGGIDVKYALKILDNEKVE